jgi:gamma-glutamylcyclotransferase (GGCT)/AIG2-like uncharacterized protein YtfP
MDLDDLRGWFSHQRLEPPQIVRSAVGVLEDHELTFNYYSRARQGGAANVEPARGREVYGLILWVDALTLAGLDVKEGAPHRYERRRVNTTCAGGGLVRAWLYSVTPAYRSTHFVAPGARYLGLLTRAAEQHAFPEAYRRRLRNIGTTQTDSEEGPSLIQAALDGISGP